MPAETQEQGWTKMAESALKQLVDIQSMIEIMSERLVALRDLRQQEYIKQDIRSLEVLWSKILVYDTFFVFRWTFFVLTCVTKLVKIFFRRFFKS